jgi:hypothetical protein
MKSANGRTRISTVSLSHTPHPSLPVESVSSSPGPAPPPLQLGQPCHRTLVPLSCPTTTHTSAAVQPKVIIRILSHLLPAYTTVSQTPDPASPQFPPRHSIPPQILPCLTPFPPPASPRGMLRRHFEAKLPPIPSSTTHLAPALPRDPPSPPLSCTKRSTVWGPQDSRVVRTHTRVPVCTETVQTHTVPHA